MKRTYGGLIGILRDDEDLLPFFFCAHLHILMYEDVSPDLCIDILTSLGQVRAWNMDMKKANFICALDL
jgi:hypothetical protein